MKKKAATKRTRGERGPDKAPRARTQENAGRKKLPEAKKSRTVSILPSRANKLIEKYGSLTAAINHLYSLDFEEG
jgi:hypothetical protein